nr:hypothetical protein [Saccharibacter sp. 17.LH.SD]
MWDHTIYKGARRSLWCVGAFAILTGCASKPDLQQKNVLNSMIGQSTVDVLRRFGVPARDYRAQGHEFLGYIQTETEYSPGTPDWGWGWGGGYGYGYGSGWGMGPGGWGGGFPPTYSSTTCQTTFELVNDRVTGWTLRGDGC